MRNIKGYIEHLSESLKSPDKQLSDLLSKEETPPIERVKELLQAGANVDGEGFLHSAPPLVWAATRGHLEVAKLLIDLGANVNIYDHVDDTTPLHLAVQGGHDKIVRLLIDNGATVDARSGNEPTPLMDASTPLMDACWDGKTDIVKILIDAGANVNAKNQFGWFPLFYAAMNGHSEVAKILIDSGADVDARIDKGEITAQKRPVIPTAMIKALLEGHRETLRVLIDSGATLRKSDLINAFYDDDELQEFLKRESSWIPAEILKAFKEVNRSRGAFGRF